MKHFSMILALAAATALVAIPISGAEAANPFFTASDPEDPDFEAGDVGTITFKKGPIEVDGTVKEDGEGGFTFEGTCTFDVDSANGESGPCPD